MSDLLSLIIGILSTIWLFIALLLTIYLLTDFDCIKEMLSKLLFVDKFKTGNCFGKILIILLIIISIPSIILAFVFSIIIIALCYMTKLIKKLGGWEEKDD